MKKKIAVALCVMTLLFTCTFAAAAEGEGGGDVMWNLWQLLNLQNVNYLGIITMLLTTVVTFIRMFFANGGLQNLFAVLKDAIGSLFSGLK